MTAGVGEPSASDFDGPTGSQNGRRGSLVGYLAVLAACVILYGITAAPDIIWQDSGMAILRAWRGDIAGWLGLALSHPSYYLPAQLMVKLPLGEPAWRLNLFSALCAAVAVANCWLLVRRLTGQFKVRVELRQVGTRDEAKLVGGFGRCGRPLCCASFLTEFTPVSIKMAKEQELPLNPMKISGTCGRLMCCLAYEGEQYRIMKEKMPKSGQRVSTHMGEAIVVGSNPLKETVLVELDSEARVELPLADVSY